MKKEALAYHRVIEEVETEYEAKLEQQLMEHPGTPKRIACLTTLRLMIKKEVEQSRKDGMISCF